MTYKKHYEDEEIKVGDLVSLVPNFEEVTRSCTKHFKQPDNLVIGVCSDVKGTQIEVRTKGIIMVRVTGLVCVGDKLTASDKAGLAKAIKYSNDESRIFDIRSIGKVIGLYNDYNIARVLLDIE